jgi:uncharacterized protein YndB with AHSA1/START domain
MERMQFKTSIAAEASKVYTLMLAQDTYRQWTSIFSPSSEYEGSWSKGEKIRFIGVNKEGKKEGMVGLIHENVPNKFVSVEYTGMLDGDNEVTQGPLVDGWVGAYENYTFDEENGSTALTVDVDVHDTMQDYFKDSFPKALNKLKEICEA